MASEAPEARRRRGRKARVSATGRGAWYPSWYWPSFTLPGLIWLAVFFVLPFIVVVAVTFGTVDELFRTPIPVYQPWWWSLDTFTDTLGRFYAGDRIYLDPLIRTLLYVGIASLICLVLGYAVAYYTARHAGKWRGLVLILLISPLWISYLMRIYAWQSLLQPDGYINDILGVFGVAPVNWLAGNPVTVDPRPRLRLHPVHDPAAVRVPRPDPAERPGSGTGPRSEPRAARSVVSRSRCPNRGSWPGS